jgi:hypothetical protein
MLLRTPQECGVSYSPYAKGAASRASLMEPEAAGAACMAEAKKLWDRLPPAVQQVSSIGVCAGGADTRDIVCKGDFGRQGTICVTSFCEDLVHAGESRAFPLSTFSMFGECKGCSGNQACVGPRRSKRRRRQEPGRRKLEYSPSRGGPGSN